MGGRRVLAGFGLMLFGAFAASAQTLAHSYLRESLQALGHNRNTEAGELLSKAEEYDTLKGDQWALKGILASRSGRFGDAKTYLEQAWASQPWGLVSFAEPAKAWMTALIRLKEYARLESWHNTHPEAALHPDLVELRVLSFLRSGRSPEALSLLLQGRRLYGFHPGLLSLTLSFPGDFPSLERQLADARSRGLRWDPSQVREILTRLPADEASRRWVLNELHKMSRSPCAELAAWLYLESLQTWEETVRVFEKEGPPLDLALWRRLTQFSELPSEWMSLSAAYEGPLPYDSDGDGFPDQELILKNGRALAWHQDRDQDGTIDQTWSFDEQGRPAKVSRTIGQQTQVWHYESFPYLSRIEVLQGNQLNVLYASPYMTALPVQPELLGAPWFWNEALSSTGLPQWEDLLAELPLWEERQTDGRLLRRTHLLDGRAFRQEEDLDKDGVLESWSLFSQGRRIKRYMDLDGDGVPEFADTFGDVILTLADLNQDRRTETVLGPGEVQLWDYGQDGRADVFFIPQSMGGWVQILPIRALQSPDQPLPPWPVPVWP